MSYYKIIGFDKEPFSTSPDPDFFYRSFTHKTALKRLEIAIRLRRGLSLILGDVGAGKTTLSRTLIKDFNDDEDFVFFMVMDPGYRTEFQFLFHLTKMFSIAPKSRSTLELKECLEMFLFKKGVDENKTIVLLLDEGQVISRENLEVLRMLLNYETNEFKLLQLVIFAQNELFARLCQIRNFSDRIALKYSIKPLDEIDTARMIEYRIKKAGYRGDKELFSAGAVGLIHKHTGGHPRKIAMLCHEALENLVMQEMDSVNEQLIEEIINTSNNFFSSPSVVT